MTREEFRNIILQGILSKLPVTKLYELDINHALNRKAILNREEQILAVKNALRYFSAKHYAILAEEFANEFKKYGRIYTYRFRLDYKICARSIYDYPYKWIQAAWIILICSAIISTMQLLNILMS